MKMMYRYISFFCDNLLSYSYYILGDGMNYKIVIDPGHGGNDSGVSGNGLVEKDYALLISNYIKERLDTLGIPNIITRNTDRTLSDDERVGIIQSSYGNDRNVIVLSNHLNKGGESGLEIVYPLRDNDRLASLIADQIELAGYPVNKYYQLRDPSNTTKDYYPIIRDTPTYKTVLVSYGYVDNSSDANRMKNNYLDYAEAVVRAIAMYTGYQYVPIGTDYYVVEKGDSLYKIASNFGISVDALKKANNLTSNLLNIGQVLIIPGTTGGSPMDPSIPPSPSNTYVVKSGDSLYKIAGNYGVTVDALKNANNLTSNLLSIGQILVIPNGSSTPSQTYSVQAGDTLYKIANSYGITVDALKSFNNLTSNNLSIGQILRIPASTSRTYTVKSGDTLYRIAANYGVSVDSLKRANNLTGNNLSIGQVLVIP